jgi:NADPH-dependent F420 reductase
MGGTGAEGRGLAARLAAAEVPVVVGSRTMERAREAAEKIQASAGVAVEAATNEEIIQRCDRIFLAVPLEGAVDLILGHGDRFRPGTVLIDLTVPLAFTGGVPTIKELPEGSAAEHLKARLSPAVGLAAALKTVPAHVLGHPELPLDCDEFVCGDSAESRAAAMELLGKIPALRLLDVGGLEAARTLERMTLLAIVLNKRYKVRTARFRVAGL